MAVDLTAEAGRTRRIKVTASPTRTDIRFRSSRRMAEPHAGRRPVEARGRGAGRRPRVRRRGSSAARGQCSKVRRSARGSRRAADPPTGPRPACGRLRRPGTSGLRQPRNGRIMPADRAAAWGHAGAGRSEKRPVSGPTSPEGSDPRPHPIDALLLAIAHTLPAREGAPDLAGAVEAAGGQGVVNLAAAFVTVLGEQGTVLGPTPPERLSELWTLAVCHHVAVR